MKTFRLHADHTADLPTNVLKWLIAMALAAVAAPADAGALRLAGDRIFVPVRIEGVATEALLDSGAEMTLVDAGFAERLGLAVAGHEMARGTGGEAAVQFAAGLEIESAGVTLTDLTAAVLDLGDVSRRLVGEPVTVVLGRELFDQGRFLLDVETRRLERLNEAHEPAGTPLPLRDHRGIKQLPIRIEGIDAWADFDLGNGSEMLLGRTFAAGQGWLSEDRLAGRKAGGGLGGHVMRDLVTLRSVQIAGVDLGPVVAAVDPTANAATANVGVSLLRHFQMVIDFPGNRVWLIHSDGE